MVTRFTRRDLEMIEAAMDFILAGEWPFEADDEDDPNLRRDFERTADKVGARCARSRAP